MRYELTDGEWGVIAPGLPNKPRGVPRVDDRRVLNGIFWVLRSGAPWRDLPKGYGPHTACYNRFVRWRRAGVWDKIMGDLAAAHDASVQMIDTSVVRVHQHGACIAGNKEQHMGRSRGGLTSKVHAVVDANGLPVRLGLTPGEAHDNRLCPVLLAGLRPRTMVLADRGYDADWIRAFVNQQGAWANIPPKQNRKDPICFSPHLYRARNLVERFFNKIKQCRRIATRCDKLAANYLAFIKLASIRFGCGLMSPRPSPRRVGCDAHPAVTSDPDIFRAAKLLMDQHSADPGLRAAGRADQLLDAGDLIGAATWRRILKAIEELRRGRREGEPVN